MFTPEFRNRLDAVVPFAGLPPEVITKVVEKFIFQLEAQLADRGVTIELSEEATQLAGREGLRREVRRPSARPRHPGAHQEAARRRAAVRQARARRHGEGGRRRQGRGPQARASSSWRADPNKRPKAKSEDDEDDDDAADGSCRRGPAQGAAEPEGAQGASAEDVGHRSQRAAPQGRVARFTAPKRKAPDPKSGAFFVGAPAPAIGYGAWRIGAY